MSSSTVASTPKMLEIQGDIAELELLKKQATRKNVTDILSIEVRKLETQLIKLRDEASVQSPDSSIPNGTPSSNKPKRYQIKLNGYGWDQSDKFVKVFVTLKNVQTLPSENVYCELTTNSMELHVKDLDNKDYTLVINKLLKSINPNTCHWKQKTDTVVIFLAKSDPGATWSHMTEIEKRFEENKSSKMNKESMEGKDPQDSLMGLMRNMYEKGDDDMKRMINKAWTEGQDKQASRSMDL